MKTLKVTAIGKSMGVVLPKDMLERLRFGKGDLLYAVETPDGIMLTAYDPNVAAQMEGAEKVMRDRRSALRKLAK